MHITAKAFSGTVRYLPGFAGDTRVNRPHGLEIDHLDGVILSHNHPDHASGLTYIIERFPVGQFYHAVDLSELDAELTKDLRRCDVPLSMVDEGWTCIRKDSRQALCLFVPDLTAADMNERSIAVYARHLDKTALLTADMGEAALQQLSANEGTNEINLLKMPHHGSRYAAPELFLKQFSPSAAFVSAGRDNPYGFPHNETVVACARRQIPLYRTGRMGMLRFHLQDGQWQHPHAP